MKKPLLILFILSSFYSIAFAQDFSYGTASPQEMDMKNYAKDTSAHAVVLNEYGSSRLVVANDDYIKLIFEYHVKIKIFDAKGFDNGTVAIKIRNDENNSISDEVDNITGDTYYKDENGLTQKVSFDPKKVYTTRDYKYESTSKFTMPGLRNGCVIEYKYRLASPFFQSHFHPWEFQSNIPKVFSEYEAHIPGQYNYNASIKGNLKLTKTKAELERDCFSTQGAKSDCSDMVYGMADIPAFVEEDYMTSPKNFISAISFELVDHLDPYSGAKIRGTAEWKDIDYTLKTDQSFGGQLKRKELLKERIVPVVVGKTDDLEKAKAIYAYLQKWFKWNDYIGMYSLDGIKKALDLHSGSIADINISLIAALNSAGINTEAVLLSTRDHGVVNNLYPAINDFNYVIAKATIGDKSYLLDATDPLLPFGVLPLRCLNDKGRVFSLDKPSYWMDLNVPQKETSSHVFDFTLQENGKIKGTIINRYIGYQAYERRKAIKKFNTIDEYVEDLAAKLPKFKILKWEIVNLDSLNTPLDEKYEVEINLYNKADGDNLVFNPFFLDKLDTNPFKLAERSFPVDRGMPSEDRFILTMHLPSQYTVEKPLQPMAISLPNNGGRFLSDYVADNNSFTFSNVIQFNKSIYTPEEYPYLKEIFNKIIQTEKTEMVFKKK
jgi:hypothetical protein